MPENLENSAVATGLEKVSIHSNFKEGQCQNCSNCHTIAFISHAIKVMFKILQARLQQYMNKEFPDVQARFRKGRGTEIKLPVFAESWKKQGSGRKKICFTKSFDYVDHKKLWEIHKEMGVP